MSFAYLALYTGDYLRDTRHLSCSEHGIYLLLLMHCWDSRGPVPLDERKQCGICGARSGDEIEALRRVLNEFFVQMDDGWYNSRMQREVERSQAISAARSDAGFKGYQAKAKQLPSKRQATATTPPPPLTPPPSSPPSFSSLSDSQNKKALSGKPDEKAGLKAQALEILEYLNANTKRNYRPVDSNVKLIVARLQSGATPLQCREVIFAKCQQWIDDPKMAEYLRPATLFNATKFEQYLGEQNAMS
jgi:uncharacterized phage protein (TIGR02220 family)